MLSLNQTHQDRRLIRVIVAPIGNNSLFADQFQIVSSLKTIPFFELNRPVSSKSSPFKFLNWKDGELLFEYLRYDRSSAGPGDLDDFQSSKRIWMVMGLVNFPELAANPKVIPEEIEHFTRRYNHIGLKRVFVFNYNFDIRPSSLQLRPLKNDPDSLIIFPPEGACEGGSMIVVHFKEVMCHATVKLINLFERFMEICEEARAKNIIPLELPLHTVYDDRDDISTAGRDSVIPERGGGLGGSSSQSSSSSRKTNIKKKPSGRLHKWMGDLSMQVCSPLDAIDHYIAAIVELRSTVDPLWLAGALDGYASVVVLLKERGFNLEEIIGKDLKTVTLPPLPETDEPLPEMDRVYALVEERMTEAISIYSSSVVLRILEVEATLRLARILERAVPCFYEREQKVVDYLMKAASVPGLNSQQQIEVTIEGALICYRLGLKRKYALFLYIAALMTAESGNSDMADALLMETYQKLDSSSPPAPDLVTDSHDNSQRDVNKDDLCGAWNAVKTAIYTNGVILANETNNASSSALFLSSLLQIVCQSELLQASQNSRLSKYTNKLLGLERSFFLLTNPSNGNNNNRSNNNKNSNFNSDSTKGGGLSSSERLRLLAGAGGDRLTEESLRSLQTISEGGGGGLGRRSSLNIRDSQSGTGSGLLQLRSRDSYRERSVVSDLTAGGGTGLKGSIKTVDPLLVSGGGGGGSGKHQSISGPVSNPMNSPKPTSDRLTSIVLPPPPPSPANTTSHNTMNNNTNSRPYNISEKAMLSSSPSTINNNSNIIIRRTASSQTIVEGGGDDFLSAHFNELTSAAESAFKQGLRSLAVPSLPQKFSSLVLASDRDPKDTSSSVSAYPSTGSARKTTSATHLISPGPSKTPHQHHSHHHHQRRVFNDRFMKSLLEANLFDVPPPHSDEDLSSNTVAATLNSNTSNTAAVLGGDLSDPRVLYHLVDVDQAKEVLLSLSQFLSSSSSASPSALTLLPADQQEIALSLFYQIAERLEDVQSLSLPISIVSCCPLPLPHPLQPIPFQLVRDDPSHLVLKSFSEFVESSLSLSASPSTSSASANTSTVPASSGFRFIVDPFSKRDQEKKKREKDLLEEICWSTDLVCHVRVVLRNALSLPISLSSISLQVSSRSPNGNTTDSSPVIVYPVSLQIPPESDAFEVFVPVLCTERGELVVEKVRVMIGHFAQEIAMDAKGYPLASSSFDAAMTLSKEQKKAEKDSGLSASPSLLLETSAVKVVDRHLAMQCFCSWVQQPLLQIRGPTANHLTCLKSKLSFLSRETRNEKIWIAIPSSASDDDLTRLFQVKVIEYENEEKSCKKCYLLCDFFSSLPSPSSRKNSLIQKIVASGGFVSSNRPASVTLSMLPAKISTSKKLNHDDGGLDWFELSFEMRYRQDIHSVDIEIETMAMRNDLFSAIACFLSEEPSSGSSSSNSNGNGSDWLRPFLSKEIDLAKELETNISIRKLSLSVLLEEEALIACEEITVAQLPSSALVPNDLLLRQLLLTQWKCQQDEKQQIMSVAAITRKLLEEESEEDNRIAALLSEPQPSSLQVDHSLTSKQIPSSSLWLESTSASSSSIPTMVIFRKKLIIQYKITNQSSQTMMIGTSLETVKKSLLTFLSQDSSSSIPSSSSGGVIFSLEEAMEKDYLLTIPPKNSFSLLIEYSHELFLHWLKSRAEVEGGYQKEDCSSVPDFIPLYWVCYDKEKVILELDLELDLDLDLDGSSSSSSYQSPERFLRSGLVGRVKSETIPDSDTTKKNAKVMTNSSYQMDPSLNLSFLEQQNKPTKKNPPVNYIPAVFQRLSEVGRLLYRFPACSLVADISIHPKLFSMSGQRNKNQILEESRVAMTGSDDQIDQHCHYQLQTLQKIEIDWSFNLREMFLEDSAGNKDSLEILLIVSDHYDEKALDILKESLEKRLNPLEEEHEEGIELKGRDSDGFVHNYNGDFSNDHRNDLLPETSSTMNVPSLSYLVDGKLHCKYSLFSKTNHVPSTEKGSSKEEIAHRTQLTFLHPSRYSLFCFFRFISRGLEEGVWWCCERPLQLVIVNQ